MRITDLELLVLGTSGRNLTFLKLFTDEGLVGISEARLSTRTEPLLAYLAAVKHRASVGTDPFETEKLVDRMFYGDFGRLGEIVATAIALVEVACGNLMGKALNVPVYRLLGGAVHDRIKACASGWSTVERTFDKFARTARRAVAKGYRALKFDPFGAGRHELSRPELHEAIGLCEAVRAAVGPDAELLIEMHGRFSTAMAVKIARVLERIDPGWVEEPVPADNLKALAKAARQIRIPVATGAKLNHRYDFRELFERESRDIIQPDLTHCRSLFETKKLAAIADMHYLVVAPITSPGRPPTCTSPRHSPPSRSRRTSTTFKTEKILKGGPNMGKLEDPVNEAVSGCLEAIDGYFSLPQGPGLGVRLNEEVIRAHPMQLGFFNLDQSDWHKRQATPI